MALKIWGPFNRESKNIDSHSQLYPVSEELLRRASLPKTIGLELQNLQGLWDADVISRQTVRNQLVARLATENNRRTINNLIVLVSFWQYWGFDAEQGLQCLRSLESRVQVSDHGGALNYYGLRAREEAITGDFVAAFHSLQRTADFLRPHLAKRDLWNFTNRVASICYYAGFQKHTQAFTKASLLLAEETNCVDFNANAQFIYAATLVDSGHLAQGEKLLTRLLNNTLSGIVAIVPIDLPMLPIHLANAQIMQNRPDEANTLLSQSLEFSANAPMRLGEMHRNLAVSRLRKAQGNTRGADVELNYFCERMLDSQFINFSMVDNCLDLLKSTARNSLNRNFSEMLEWQQMTRPPLKNWAPLLMMLHVTLLSTLPNKGVVANSTRI